METEKIFLLILAVLIVSIAVIPGCALNGSDPGNADNVGNSSPNAVVDYHNGVYFFPYTGSEFGNTLSHFIAQHPHLELASIAPYSKPANKVTINGYFVVFHEKPRH